MRIILKAGVLVFTTEHAEDIAALSAWRAASAGHVFYFDGGTETGGAMLDIGPRPEACREPINIVFDDGPTPWQPISNLAHTPFVLRGLPYASIEGFWQGLKFASTADRARVAPLWGHEAKRATPVTDATHFLYDGQTVLIGGAAHHDLMLEACRAKFRQHLAAREALLATGQRPLTHRVRRDSRTIPGALMADIWMRVRAELA